MYAFPYVLQRPCVGLCSVAVIATLAACARPEPAPEPVRAVKLLTVGHTPLHAQLEYAGEVRPRIESRLGFRVAGKLVQRYVELGQSVQAGQLLAQLDAQDYALAAQAAQAQVTAAATQRDVAAADLKRFTQLKAQNFISGAELERRQAQFEAAQAQWVQASTQAQTQNHQQSYTRLLADSAGVVTAIDAEPGQVLSTGQSVLRVAQGSARDVVFAVPEDKVAHLHTGHHVHIRPWSGGPTWSATIRDVAASADPVTRTFTIKAAVPAAQMPALGTTVHVSPQALSRSGQVAITLPSTALREEGARTTVWVFDAATSTVRSQPIELASADGNEAVVASGLTPGMQVVATGVHVLAPGQKVSVYQPKTAPKSTQNTQQTHTGQAPAAIDSIAPTAVSAAPVPGASVASAAQ